eukprot:XP_010650361.1 PREDICTED: LRR receptor-like serine/threonine-protein kinase EFR [Vitis vinifera]
MLKPHNHFGGADLLPFWPYLEIANSEAWAEQSNRGYPIYFGKPFIFLAAFNGVQSFGGGISHDLSHLKCLKYLYLDVNNLSGMIPPLRYNWSSAIEFFVSGNILSGNFTPNMRFNFPQLRKFCIAGNQFTGIIPDTLSNISGLELLDLGNNYLTGQVPDSLGVLKDLYCSFKLESHSSTPTFGNETDKLALLAFKNYVANVPNGVLSSWNDSLHFCQWEGVTCSHQLQRVTALRLESQRLAGSLPPIENLTFLRELELSNNNLHATDNHLSGNFMSNMRFSSPQLCKFGKAMNQFTGIIPDTLSNISGLELLDLGDNHLTGKVPDSLGVLKDLYWLTLDFNSSGRGMSGDLNFLNSLTNISGLRLINAEGNHFGGVLPNSIVNLSTQLQQLVLGENKISGNIPKEIGNLINLIQFIATWNYLTGIIPTSIGKLQNLGELDFGWNRLSGEVVPSGGVFKNVNGISITGNKKLCGEIPQLHLPPCFVVESAKHAKGKHPSIKIIIAISIAGVSCLAFIVASGFLQLKATGAFASSNLIGMGSFGSVYKGIPSQGERQVAVKTPIVHGDLKPSNVLLDDDMVAHVGDFGLAKLFPEADDMLSSDQTSSTLMMGSIGYVAPEYGLGGSMWPQGDVYSYGILFLEMFKGKRPTEHMFPDGLSLHSFSKMALPERVMEIADSNLVGESGEATNNIANHGDVEGRMQHYLASIARIGVACSEESLGDRMDIKETVMELI